MATIDDKIAAQLEKLAQLKALKAKQEAQARAEKAKKEHAADTRRKVLLGAMLLEQMQLDPATNTELTVQLDRWLTRNNDRALFGLPALPVQPGTTAPQPRHTELPQV